MRAYNEKYNFFNSSDTMHGWEGLDIKTENLGFLLTVKKAPSQVFVELLVFLFSLENHLPQLNML